MVRAFWSRSTRDRGPDERVRGDARKVRAWLSLENISAERFRVSREVTIHQSQKEMDEQYGWGFRWTTGRFNEPGRKGASVLCCPTRRPRRDGAAFPPSSFAGSPPVLGVIRLSRCDAPCGARLERLLVRGRRQRKSGRRFSRKARVLARSPGPFE